MLKRMNFHFLWRHSDFGKLQCLNSNLESLHRSPVFSLAWPSSRSKIASTSLNFVTSVGSCLRPSSSWPSPSESPLPSLPEQFSSRNYLSFNPHQLSIFIVNCRSFSLMFTRKNNHSEVFIGTWNLFQVQAPDVFRLLLCRLHLHADVGSSVDRWSQRLHHWSPALLSMFFLVS